MERVAKVGTQTRKMVGVERGREQLQSAGSESAERAALFPVAHASGTAL